MKKILLPIAVLSGLVLVSCGPAPVTNSNTNGSVVNMNVNTALANLNTNTSMSGTTMRQDPTIRVTEPAANALVTSPFTVSGQASGWYFEASFGVKVVDANGKQLYQGAVMATDDWMTTAFVPFSAQIALTEKPTTTTGKIIFEKANPSGLPEMEQTFEVPVRFNVVQ